MSTERSRPVLLLDIDGVVSPLSTMPTAKPVAPWVQFSSWMVTDGVSESLRAISAHVDIIWASGWEEDSLVLAQELGIASSGYLDFSQRVLGRDIWFKEDAVAEFISRNVHRTIIWAEDEAPPDVVSRCQQAHDRLLVVEPSGSTGLSSEDFHRISRFLADTGYDVDISNWNQVE